MLFFFFLLSFWFCLFVFVTSPFAPDWWDFLFQIHLPPMGLTQKKGRTFRHQEKLRKISKPLYLKSHDEIS